MEIISIRKIGQVVGSYVAKKVCRFEQAEYLSYGDEILIEIKNKIALSLLKVLPEKRIITLGVYETSY